jgi:hypothetical protein
MLSRLNTSKKPRQWSFRAPCSAILPRYWPISSSCFGGRCKCSWQGKSDVLEGFTTETMFCIAPGKCMNARYHWGFSGIRNRGSCKTCSEDGKSEYQHITTPSEYGNEAP